MQRSALHRSAAPPADSFDGSEDGLPRYYSHRPHPPRTSEPHASPVWCRCEGSPVLSVARPADTPPSRFVASQARAHAASASHACESRASAAPTACERQACLHRAVERHRRTETGILTLASVRRGRSARRRTQAELGNGRAQHEDRICLGERVGLALSAGRAVSACSRGRAVTRALRATCARVHAVACEVGTLEVLSVSMCATSTRAPPAMMSMRHAAGFERHASCREIGRTARCACAAQLHRRAPGATARGDLHVCVHARASTPTSPTDSWQCGRVVVGLRARSANIPQQSHP
jgi:hypothetical protein